MQVEGSDLSMVTSNKELPRNGQNLVAEFVWWLHLAARNLLLGDELWRRRWWEVVLGLEQGVGNVVSLFFHETSVDFCVMDCWYHSLLKC